MNIATGDWVTIETPIGKVKQRARLSTDFDPRYIVTQHGWWFPEESVDSLSGWQRSNFNMLTSTAKLGQEFGTPNLKGINCAIRRKSPEKDDN